MALKLCIVLSTLMTVSLSQRPSFAGRRPIGIPQLETTTTTENSNELGNRFGDHTPTRTTVRLPIEVLGDKELFNRLNKLPVDKQPFWFINWKAQEENRKNPQTYNQKPPGFTDPNQQWG